MFVFSGAMQKPTILEEEKHKNLRLALPSDFSFLRKVVALPLGYSEIIAATMYYPVLFGIKESFIYPYAVLGVEEKNIFISDEGQFIVDVIPKCAELYPFGIAKKGDDYLVVYDEKAESSDGEPVFAEDGRFTPFFNQRKEELTNYAIDINQALEFAKTAYENGLLKLIEALKIDTKHGSLVLNNVLIANAVEAIPKLSPEKLYHFNVTGYLPILYATYFSVRNFKLFDLIA